MEEITSDSWLLGDDVVPIACHRNATKTETLPLFEKFGWDWLVDITNFWVDWLNVLYFN